MRAFPLLLGIGVILSAHLCLPGPARAQRPAGAYPPEVGERLADFAGWSRYARTHEPFYDALAEGGSRSVTIRLTAGVPYLIYGACDDDCGDLDFVLFDANDNEVDRDTAADASPVVEVTPWRTGSFRLRAEMYACSAAPCHWGFSVFRR